MENSMKTFKSLTLFLLVSLTCNAFGMEQDWPAAEEETESNVSSLRELCAKRATQLIQEDPAFCEKEGQPELTKDAEELVASELMKDHPIIRLILSRLIKTSTDQSGNETGNVRPSPNEFVGLDDGAAELYNSHTNAHIRTFIGHTGPVNSSDFSPDGSQVLTASDDNTAKLWNKNTGACIRTFSDHTDAVWSAKFSPDGLKILTISQDTIKLWNAQTSTCIYTF